MKINEKIPRSDAMFFLVMLINLDKFIFGEFPLIIDEYLKDFGSYGRKADSLF